MRIVPEVLLLALTVVVQGGAAQTSPPGPQSSAQVPEAACGEPKVKFVVKTEKRDHPGSQPDTKKALVYFFEDDSHFDSMPKPTTRMGIDGQWVGATHGNSYFYVSVDPGEHHLCANWQSFVVLGQGHQTALAHFSAQAGGTYYFAVKNRWSSGLAKPETVLKPLASDEGLLLTTTYAFSTSQKKR